MIKINSPNFIFTYLGKKITVQREMRELRIILDTIKLNILVVNYFYFSEESKQGRREMGYRYLGF